MSVVDFRLSVPGQTSATHSAFASRGLATEPSPNAPCYQGLACSHGGNRRRAAAPGELPCRAAGRPGNLVWQPLFFPQRNRRANPSAFAAARGAQPAVAQPGPPAASVDTSKPRLPNLNAAFLARSLQQEPNENLNFMARARACAGQNCMTSRPRVPPACSRRCASPARSGGYVAATRSVKTPASTCRRNWSSFSNSQS